MIRETLVPGHHQKTLIHVLGDSETTCLTDLDARKTKQHSGIAAHYLLKNLPVQTLS